MVLIRWRKTETLELEWSIKTTQSPFHLKRKRNEHVIDLIAPVTHNESHVTGM